MLDPAFRAKMLRADRAFQRAIASALAPDELKPEPPRPAPSTAVCGKLRQARMPSKARRLAMAKRDLKYGWDLDSAARHSGFDRKDLDLELWRSFGRAK